MPYKADNEMSFYENFSKHFMARQLDAIIDSSFDAIWIFSGEGRVLRVNKAAEEINDIKAEQVLNKSVPELLDQSWFDRSATLEVLRTKETVTMTQNLRNGRQVFVTGTPVFHKDGSIALIVVNGRDITELSSLRSKLEKSLALSKEYHMELTHLYTQEKLLSEVIIKSELMKRVFNTAMKVAQVDSTALIQGESGVGKSLMAKLIHRASGRSNGPFIRVDCGAIPESLLESELFGYERGAFTGARTSGKPGHFEMAEGGTLFLDEVGELPFSIQVKLLRFIEDNEVVPIGGTTPKTIDTRIIAATNNDLNTMVDKKRFRSDLFYRLNVVPIKIPPLRERLEDIPSLVHFFLQRLNQKCSTKKIIHPLVLDRICEYSCPGNIRELANLIEHLIVLSPNECINVEDLPSHLQKEDSRAFHSATEQGWNLRDEVERTQKRIIIKALKTFGSKRKAAGPLGIHHSTLVRKVKQYGIDSGASQRFGA